MSSPLYSEWEAPSDRDYYEGAGMLDIFGVPRGWQPREYRSLGAAANELFDLPSVDASGACTCCGAEPPPRACTQVGTGGSHCRHHDADTPCCWCGAGATGDETPCVCLGDDCPECGACLLAHCECDPGGLDEDQMTPARPVESASMRESPRGFTQCPEVRQP